MALSTVDPIQEREAGMRALAPDALGALLDDHSVEVTPAQVSGGDVDRFLAPGTRVFVPWLPGAAADATVAAAVELRERGMVPVPHVAARAVPDTVSLGRLLRRLRSEAAVDRLLVVGGDVASPTGPFDSALRVLETDLLSEHGIARVGIGGYPEGHPRVSGDELLDALLRKQDRAARAGLDAVVVTQFAFAAAPVIDWLRRARAAGVRLPVHVGVPGPARVGALMHYARMCGIGPSMKLLLRHGKGLAGAARVANASRMVLDLAAYAAERPDAGLGPLHVYPFGGLKRAADWIESLGDRGTGRAGEPALKVW